MVFFQLNVTGLLFQSFRTASPTVEGDIEMIYVDNCSDDDSVEYIKKNYP